MRAIFWGSALLNATGATEGTMMFMAVAGKWTLSGPAMILKGEAGFVSLTRVLANAFAGKDFPPYAKLKSRPKGGRPKPESARTLLLHPAKTRPRNSLGSQL